MSLLKSNSVQIGQSATATQNFTLSVPSSPDGTIKLARGNSGATTADVLTVDASGNVTTTLADGIVTPAKLAQPLTLATAQATTSGTAIDFTGIPSWVARIMVTFGGVSVSGTSPFLVQLGTGAGPTFTSSGYTSIGISFGGSGLTSTARTNGFAFADTVSAAYTYGGNAVIAKVSGNIYSFNSTLAAATASGDGSCVGAGSVSLGAILTSIRITTVGGANTFDAGSVNIMYEG